MKFHRIEHGYAHNIHIVELEGPELDMSDADLITLADNNGNMALGRRHFGGKVERKLGRKTNKIYARIKVHTD